MMMILHICRQVWTAIVSPKCVSLWDCLPLTAWWGERLETCCDYQTGMEFDVFCLWFVAMMLRHTSKWGLHSTLHTVELFPLPKGDRVAQLVECWTRDPKTWGSNLVCIRKERNKFFLVFIQVKHVVLTSCQCAQPLCVYAHIMIMYAR